MSVETLDARLISEDGREFPVRIVVSVRSHLGGAGVEDSAATDPRFTQPTNAPDGRYELEYFYGKMNRDTVAVRSGRIVG
jgi:hypothetical protein